MPVGGHQFSLFVRAKRCFLNPVKNQTLCLSIPHLFQAAISSKNLPSARLIPLLVPVGGHQFSLFVRAKRCFLNPVKNQTLCLSIPHLFQAAISSKNLPSARLIPLLVPVGGHQFSLFVRAKRCFLNPVKNQSVCLSIPDLFAKNHSLVPAKRRFLNPIKNQTLCLSIPHLFQAAISSKNLPSARLIPLLVPVGGHQFSLFVRAKRCFLNPVKNQTLCLSIPHLFQAAISSKNLPSARLIPLLVPVGGHQFSLFVRAKRCFLNPVKNQTLCLSIPHLFQAAISSKNLPSARLIPLLVPVGGHQFSLFVRAKRCFLNPAKNQSVCLSIPDLFAKNHSLVPAKRRFLNPIKNQTLCLSIPHLFQAAISSKNLPSARLIPLLVPVGGHQFSLFVRAKRCFLNPVKNQTLCLSIPHLFQAAISSKNLPSARLIPLLVPVGGHQFSLFVRAKRCFLNPVKNQTLCLSIPHLFQAAISSKNLPSARLIPLLVPVGGHQFSLFVRAKRCFLNPVKNQSVCLSIPDLFAKNHSLVPAKRRFLNPIKNQTLCLSIPHLFQAAISSKNLPSARLIPLLVPVGGHQFSLFVRAKRCFLNPVKNQTLCLSIPHLFQAAISSKNLPSARLIPLLVPVGGHQFSLFVRAKRCFLNPVKNQVLS